MSICYYSEETQERMAVSELLSSSFLRIYRSIMKTSPPKLVSLHFTASHSHLQLPPSLVPLRGFQVCKAFIVLDWRGRAWHCFVSCPALSHS